MAQSVEDINLEYFWPIIIDEFLFLDNNKLKKYLIYIKTNKMESRRNFNLSKSVNFSRSPRIGLFDDRKVRFMVDDEILEIGEDKMNVAALIRKRK